MMPFSTKNRLEKRVYGNEELNVPCACKKCPGQLYFTLLITPKEALSLKVHVWAIYIENNDLQHKIDDITTTIEEIRIQAKKQASIIDFFH